MLSEKQKSICRFGSYGAFAAGFFYVVIVGCAFLSPDSIASYVTNDQYFQDFLGYRNIFIFLKWLMLGANMAMIAVVLAFHSLHRDEHSGLNTWCSAMAIIGFGVGMYQSVIDISVVPALADQYAMGNQTIKDMIIALGVANPFIYVISLGMPGLWFMVVSWRALDNKAIPRYLVVLGFLWGSGNIMTVIAHALIIIPLIRLVSYGALLFAPLWSIGEGLYLKKLSR